MTNNPNDNNEKHNEESLSDIFKNFSKSYNADAMGGDTGLKGIRLSPAWYLTADTIEGALQALIELLQNGVDESQEVELFFKNKGIPLEQIPIFKINIKIYKDDTVLLGDTGRGIPPDYHAKFKRPTIEVAFEELNVGAKGKGFVQDGKSAYIGKTIGKHGSGAACVNATSDFFEVLSHVAKDDKTFAVRWENAEKTNPTTEVGPANGKHGTQIRFRPSRDVFKMYNAKGQKVQRFYDKEVIKNIIIEYAYNTENIEFYFEFEQPDGTFSLTEIKSADYDPTKRINEGIDGDTYNVEIINEEHDYELKIYAGFSPAYKTVIATSNMLTVKRGTHVEVFEEVANDIIYDVENFINKELESKRIKEKVLARDLKKYGIYAPSAFISLYCAIKMGDPKYSSQAKEELRVPQIIESLTVAVKEAFENELKPIKDKIIQYLGKRGVDSIEASIQLKKAKEAEKKREERKKELNEIVGIRDAKYTRGMSEEDSTIRYARTSKAEDTIVFFVEGKTSLNALSKARDINTHTIVPMDQRPPNVYNHKESKLREMKKYKMLYRLMFGTKNGNIKALVLAPDNDADGDLMRTYLIAFIYMFFPHYLYQGRVFILETPKYAAVSAMNEIKDFNTYEEREQFFSDENSKVDAGAKDKGWRSAQYKGLGSIPREVLINIIQTGIGYVRIDPKTIDEGMELVEGLLSDKVMKRYFLMDNFATPELIDYLNQRSEIIRRQEIDFNLSSIQFQFDAKADISDVDRNLPFENMLNDYRDSLTDFNQEEQKEEPYNKAYLPEDDEDDLNGDDTLM